MQYNNPSSIGTNNTLQPNQVALIEALSNMEPNSNLVQTFSTFLQQQQHVQNNNNNACQISPWQQQQTNNTVSNMANVSQTFLHPSNSNQQVISHETYNRMVSPQNQHHIQNQTQQPAPVRQNRIQEYNNSTTQQQANPRLNQVNIINIFGPNAFKSKAYFDMIVLSYGVTTVLLYIVMYTI